ncbi:MAG: GNAT family N-acetyltransferase [Pseudomonadota bacterium]
MVAAIKIRDGKPSDASDFAILADMATRRLTSFLFRASEQNGIAPLGLCRQAIQNDAQHTLHYSNWRVAERGGQLLGGLNGYIIQPADFTMPQSETERVIQPLSELKAVSEGNWYTAAVAVLHEEQGKGAGSALLKDVDARSRAIGANAVTLMVGSFNKDARRLYKRLGYTEVERRDFVTFPGSDSKGEWILMSKDLSEHD